MYQYEEIGVVWTLLSCSYLEEQGLKMNIPLSLKEKIEEVAAYIGETTTNYLTVKRQLINNFPSPSRSLFSARHPCTKKHQLNDFDKEVIRYWFELTGVELRIPSEMMHNPEWQHKKKGWALALFNRERKHAKISKQPINA